MIRESKENDESHFGAKTPLHIGDYVILRLSKPDEGWLSSAGLLEDDCFANTETNHFENCVWEIHVQNQYSAAREYKEALAQNLAAAQEEAGKKKNQHNRSAKHSKSYVDKDHLNQLHRATLNEQRLNDRLMKMKIGNPVLFGDPIQLRHVKSKKFLTVSSHLLAKEERENMRISVTTEGDSLACINFFPRFRFDREGQILTNNSEVVLRVHDRPGEFVHASKSSEYNASDDSEKFEVNCSLESSNWTICLYQRHQDIRGNLITTGQLVTLQDSDTLSCLTLMKKSSIEENATTTAAVATITSATSTPVIMKRKTVFGEMDISDDEDQEEDEINIVLSPPLQMRDIVSGLSDEVGTKFLWLIEKAEATIGGPLSTNVDQITLRDLNSGKYLKLGASHQLEVVGDRDLATCFTPHNSQGGNITTDRLIENDSTISLAHEDIWISVNPKAGSSLCEGTLDNDRAFSLIISTSLYQKLGIYTYFGVEAVMTLREMIVKVNAFRKAILGTRDLMNWLRTGDHVLDSIANFLTYYDHDSSTTNPAGTVALINQRSKADLLSKEMIACRQNMLREQGILDVLLDILVLIESGVLQKVKKPLMKRDTYSGTATQKLVMLQKSLSMSKAHMDKKSSELDNRISAQMKNRRRRGSFQLFGGMFQEANSAPKSRANSSGGKMAGLLGGGSLSRAGSVSNDAQDKAKDTSLAPDLRRNNMQPSRSSFPKVPAFSKLLTNVGTKTLKNDSDNSDDEKSEKDYDDEENDIDEDEEDDIVNEDKIDHTEYEQAQQQTLEKELAQRALKALLCCITENRINQSYVADRFPVLLSHVKNHRLAVLCVEEMLRENLHILQTKVRQREIDIFVSLLEEFPMSVTFLKLIQNTCSCPMGVDATQRMVSTALFSFSENEPVGLKLAAKTTINDHRGTHSLLIENDNSADMQQRSRVSSEESILMLKIIVDRSKLTPVTWGDFSLYCPANPHDYVLGYTELCQGLPEIWLTWNIVGKNGEYSIKNLYGCKDKVLLATVYAALYKSGNQKVKQIHNGNSASSVADADRKASVTIGGMPNRRKAAVYQNKGSTSHNVVTLTQNKLQIAEYFITQLYLAADLCLDRNYVSIGMIERLYQYDVLVSMLKDLSVPNSMKAAVCRVLRTLYVDRDPQVEQIYPRFIRTSISLGGEKGADATTEKATANELYQFALLQKMISEYINEELDLNTCDELTTEMIELLQSLVSFGFYFDIPQMMDVLKPLIRSLDEHRLPAKRGISSTVSVDEETATRKKSLFSLFTWSPKSTPIHPSAEDIQLEVAEANKKSAQQAPSSPRSVENDDEEHSSKFAKVLTGMGRCCQYMNPVPVIMRIIRFLFQELFQEYIYYFVESWFWTLFVLLAAAVSVAFVIMDIVDISEPDYFFLATLFFFAADLALRWISNISRHYNQIWKFWNQPFNVIDLVLVGLDVVIYIVISINFPVHNLRLVRIIRFARVFRAVKLVRQIQQSNDRYNWKLAPRYKSVKEQESKTMKSIIQVLTMFYDRIQDKTLDMTIKAFAFWCEEQKHDRKCDAVEVYKKMISSEERISADLSMKFDQVLLDAIMYENREMTQEAINLLMIHKSQSDIFFEICENIQIVYSPKVEAMCKSLSEMIVELKRLAEMYEIWCELETDEHLAAAQRAMDILEKIRNYLARKNEDRTLGIRSLTLIDEEVQNILRNLDAMSAFMALLEALYDGGHEELRERVLEIMCSCSDLICLFVKNCEANQNEAFKHIQWFVDRVDDNINSSKILRAMLEGNKNLIKRCPRKYLLEFAQKIIAKGHNPDYLDIFVGMSEFSNVIGSRVIAVESEICTYLTAREWKKYFLLWCDPNDNTQFGIRKKKMEKYFVGGDDVPELAEDDLSSDLRYHIRLLTLLGSCNLGPKLHAIYSINEVLQGILDVSTLFPVKKALANLLLAQIKISSERVEKNDNFWLLVQQIAADLEVIPQNIAKYFRSSQFRIQKGEWIEFCLNIIICFFDGFDLHSFMESKADKNSVNQLDVRNLLERIFAALKVLITNHASKLGSTLSEETTFAMKILKQHVDDEDHDHDQDDGDASEGVLDLNEKKLKLIRAQHQRTSVIYADVQQVFFRSQFKVFVEMLQSTHNQETHDEILNFLKRIPRLAEKVDSDVRLEPLIKKLTSHFFADVKRTSNSRMINEDVIETCKWILRSLRIFFEDTLQVNCDNITDVDTADIHDTPEVAELRNIYNENGVVGLCMELIALGVDHSLCLEAMKLLIAMMMRNGGCYSIQVTVHQFLMNNDSTLFFELVKEMLENLKSWSSNENDLQITQSRLQNMTKPTPSSSPELAYTPFAVKPVTLVLDHETTPEDMIILPFITLLCEGSYIAVRDHIRTQTGNMKFVNIIETIASYVGILSKIDSARHANVITSLLRSILRLVQGPSKANQEQFVLHTELLISLNRIIRNIRPKINQLQNHNSAVIANEHLKESVVDVLRGIIEGQSKTSLVFDRVASTIDFSVLQAVIFPDEQQVTTDTVQLFSSQSKFLVLTQSMGDYYIYRHRDRSLDDSTSKTKEVVKQEIRSVEVLWHNEITVVYFHIPDSIKDLSAESQQRVLDNIQDYASRELKLMDFMKQCKQLYRQSQHQQFLKRYGLESLWSIKHYLQRIMFANAVVMNCLVVCYYGEVVDHHPYYGAMRRVLSSAGAATSGVAGELYEPDWVKLLLLILISIQSIAALSIVAIHSTVQLPVTFAAEVEDAPNFFVALGRTLMDKLLVWYISYLLFSLLALFINHLFVSVLLLDWIVLSPITQDLLLAIVYPAKQLIVTLVLILICMNIFAGAIFVFYRQDGSTFSIHTMWDTLKLCISYGFRGEYGYDHEMIPTLGNRMVMDVIFFFVILSILREIFFAIIVDTFGTLRELKFERENEEKNSCFVCGIERHEYDLMVSSSSMTVTFAQHRAQAHNPINYLYFILNIWNQTPFDDSSLEMYVRQCLANNDVSWFPTGVLHEAHVMEIDDTDEKEHGHGGDGSGGGAVVASSESGHGSGGGHGGGHGKHGSGGHSEHGGHGEKGRARTTSFASGGHDTVHHNTALNAASSGNNGSQNNISELVEKINAMNKQLTKISKYTAQSTNILHRQSVHVSSSHGNHPTMHTSDMQQPHHTAEDTFEHGEMMMGGSGRPFSAGGNDDSSGGGGGGMMSRPSSATMYIPSNRSTVYTVSNGIAGHLSPASTPPAMMMQYGQPFGQGQTFGQPMGQSFGQPIGQPMGQPMGQPSVNTEQLKSLMTTTNTIKEMMELMSNRMNMMEYQYIEQQKQWQAYYMNEKSEREQIKHNLAQLSSFVTTSPPQSSSQSQKHTRRSKGATSTTTTARSGGNGSGTSGMSVDTTTEGITMLVDGDTPGGSSVFLGLDNRPTMMTNTMTTMTNTQTSSIDDPMGSFEFSALSSSRPTSPEAEETSVLVGGVVGAAVGGASRQPPQTHRQSQQPQQYQYQQQQYREVITKGSELDEEDGEGGMAEEIILYSQYEEEAETAEKQQEQQFLMEKQIVEKQFLDKQFLEKQSSPTPMTRERPKTAGAAYYPSASITSTNNSVTSHRSSRHGPPPTSSIALSSTLPTTVVPQQPATAQRYPPSMNEDTAGEETQETQEAQETQEEPVRTRAQSSPSDRNHPPRSTTTTTNTTTSPQRAFRRPQKTRSSRSPEKRVRTNNDWSSPTGADRGRTAGSPNKTTPAWMESVVVPPTTPTANTGIAPGTTGMTPGRKAATPIAGPPKMLLTNIFPTEAQQQPSVSQTSQKNKSTGKSKTATVEKAVVENNNNHTVPQSQPLSTTEEEKEERRNLPMDTPHHAPPTPHVGETTNQNNNNNNNNHDSPSNSVHSPISSDKPEQDSASVHSSSRSVASR